MGGAGQGEPLSAGESRRDRRRQPARPARADRAGLGSGRLRSRAHAFGARVLEVDGHDLAAVDEALSAATRPADGPTVILARTIKGRGFSEVEDREGWHGKAFPEDMAARAIAELGGESNLVVRGPLPEHENANGAGSVREAGPAISAPSYARGDKVATRRAYGDAVTALGAHDARRSRPRRRGQQLDLRRRVRQGPSGPLLRDVHRRATDGGIGRRAERPRLQTVCLDLRGVPHARPRLHPHGRDLAGKRPSRRFPCRR